MWALQHGLLTSSGGTHICLILVIIVSMATQSLTLTCVSPTTECTCDVDSTNKKTINCRGYNGLTRIPVFNQTSEVYDKIDFSAAVNTENCHPSICNQITEVPDRAFENLIVKEIDLRNNKIQSFHFEAFLGLHEVLEGLLIEGDGSNPPPYPAFSQLNNMTKLHMENFNQTFMTPATAAFSFDKLQSLTLRKFQDLQHIDGSVFRSLTAVTDFHLDKMKSMTELPVAAILNLPSLTKLEIVETEIKVIRGDSFVNLDKLADITIDANALQDLDINAFHGINDTLKFLTLKHNELTEVDFLEQYTWPILQQLVLAYNFHLNIKPGAFNVTPNLQFLNLADVGLTTIDKDLFDGLGQLHSLDVSYNKISTVKTDAFKNVPKLTELKINEQNSPQLVFEDDAFRSVYNSLQQLFIQKNKFDLPQFWNILKNLTDIIELNLVETGIQDIPDYAFRTNTKLSDLDLTSNNISSLRQAMFYGPRTVLKTINLHDNNIQTVNKCVLSDFQVQPAITLTNNPLNCDCQLLWFYDWLKSISNPFQYATMCASPPNLNETMLSMANRSDLVCDPSYQEPDCPDLYSTTTTSTTTTSTTTTTTTTTPKPTTTTEKPVPPYMLIIAAKTANSLTATWTVTDKSDVTGYQIELISNYEPKQVRKLPAEDTQYTFQNLLSGKYFTVCLVLEIDEKLRSGHRKCEQGDTLTGSDGTTSPSKTTTAAPDSQIGLIVGGSVGGVVLVALILVILFLLSRSNKPMKAPIAVRYIPRADVPQAGGTAKRFAKKPDKEGATPDDIQVTVISKGDVNNKDRISAGSYQHLNEKDPRNFNRYPTGAGPSTSNGHGLSTSRGHYVNSVEDRPLPRAPHGEDRHKNTKGYVNTGYDGEEVVLKPSTNEYYQINN